MKKAVMPYLLKCISSRKLQRLKRKINALKRVATGQEPSIEVFLKPDDPYSYVLIQVLSAIESRFAIKLTFHVFHDINPDMYPELAMWQQYAKYDAHHLAALYDLHFPSKESLPKHDEQASLQLAFALVSIEKDNDFLSKANKLLKEFWLVSGPPRQTSYDVEKAQTSLARNKSLLQNKGHYLGAMMHFEGEWYWGVDRLDHLEQRLIDAGLARHNKECVHFNRTYQNFCQTPFINHSPHKDKQPIVLYWSARSPYSYIGLERAVKLAEHYHLILEIKPVLPMVMRGMNVPPAKKMYIFLDTKREASKLGIDYGFVADPLGVAVERCYALVDYARSNNKLQAFLLSFARGVNAEGIKAETDTGLAKIVTRCGLDWALAKQKLPDQSWRQWAKINQDEMYKIGCWGVPTLRYGDSHFWGQDRFVLLEQAIQKIGDKSKD